MSVILPQQTVSSHMPAQPQNPLPSIAALIERIKAGDRAGVQTMLKTFPFLAKERRHKDENGLLDDTTALHVAAQEGHLGIVADLLDVGAVVEARDFVKQTPLMVAAQSGQAHVVKFLLEKKADPNLHAGESYTALMYAARNGCPACVTLLLDANADINAVMDGKMNALHFAAFAEKNAQETADILLKRGIAFDARDNLGHTPATSARNDGNEALAVFIETWPERKVAMKKNALAEIKSAFRAGTHGKLAAPRRARFTAKNTP